MATKKPVTKKRSAVTTKRKIASKKQVSTKKSRAVKPTKMASFRLAKSNESFMQFSPSVQSLYWIVLGVVIILFAMWVMKLQADISNIYDRIDANDTNTYLIEQSNLHKQNR